MIFLCPLLASLIYVLGALWLKRAGQEGADVWKIAYCSNAFSALCFMIIGFVLQEDLGQGLWWQPALTGVSFLIGQTLALSAFKYGDVSIATPVLGTKIILVGVFTIVMLGDYGSKGLWFGAVLATLGVGALSKSDKVHRSKVLLTLLLSFGGAAGYALFDVTLQKWSQDWGSQTYLLYTFIWVFVLLLNY